MSWKTGSISPQTRALTSPVNWLRLFSCFGSLHRLVHQCYRDSCFAGRQSSAAISHTNNPGMKAAQQPQPSSSIGSSRPPLALPSCDPFALLVHLQEQTDGLLQVEGIFIVRACLYHLLHSFATYGCIGFGSYFSAAAFLRFFLRLFMFVIADAGRLFSCKRVMCFGATSPKNRLWKIFY